MPVPGTREGNPDVFRRHRHRRTTCFNCCRCRGDLERVLFDQPTILRRVDEIAAQISADYHDLELTVIAVLNGSLIFMPDLLRRMPLPLKLDRLRAGSCHGGTRSRGEILFKTDHAAGRRRTAHSHLDDILDSGLTLTAIRRKLGEAESR